MRAARRAAVRRLLRGGLAGRVLCATAACLAATALAAAAAPGPAPAAAPAAAAPPAAGVAALAAAPPAPPRVDRARLDHGLQARALAPGVWVVEGANADFSPDNGCNIINTGFLATDDGVLVINTGPSRRYGEQLRALAERTAGRPVRGVLHLNLHPDYFLGNQAFADVPRWATAATRAGIAREAAAYEANLYRLCGDWMKGTQALAPDRDLLLPADGRWVVGGRELRVQALAGHTDSDLVLTDVASGVVFAGGLVFVDRVPTTPHARLRDWLDSLDRLEALPARVLVPSHGPVLVGAAGDLQAGAPGIAQTRAYLRWLDESFTRLAEEGASADEVLRARVPAAFRGWAAFDTEYVRNVTHLYPAYELRALRPASPRR